MRQSCVAGHPDGHSSGVAERAADHGRGGRAPLEDIVNLPAPEVQSISLVLETDLHIYIASVYMPFQSKGCCKVHGILKCVHVKSCCQLVVMVLLCMAGLHFGNRPIVLQLSNMYWFCSGRDSSKGPPDTQLEQGEACLCQGACLQPTHQRYDIDKSFCNVGTAYNPISIALLPLSQVAVIAATVTTVKLQVSVDFATTPLLLQCCNFTDFYPQQHYACLSNLVQDACH